MKVELKIGDCLDVLRQHADESFDACVTDPPYGLEFMGKDWDKLARPKPGNLGGFATGDKPSFERVQDTKLWMTGAGTSPPGIGDRATEWPSFGFKKFGGANPTCARCGGRLRGEKRCSCEDPEWMIDGKPAEELSFQNAMQAWHEAWAREVLRVLKPGAHLLAFGGDRTVHRLACAIEDAGFEIRRTIFWIYGQGFPKSENVGRGVEMQMCKLPGRHFDKTLPKDDKARAGDHICPPAPNDWIGWGTDLKPACEPIVVARKPLSTSVAKNVLKYGTGGLNIDATRILVNPDVDDMLRTTERKPRESPTWEEGSGFKNENNPFTGVRPEGRWPANVILTHDPNCKLRGMKRVKANGHFPENTGESTLFGGDQGGLHGIEQDERQIREEVVEDWDCVQDCPIRILDEQSGELQSGKGPLRRGSTTGNSIGYGGQPQAFDGSATVIGDSGGASRFFYVAKATREEREFGLGKLPARSFGQSGGAQGAIEEGRGEYIQQGNIGLNRVKKVRNFHPTVKPVELMRYLVKLVTPPGGLVLDPFAGSGTTLIAAKLEGFRALGIEKEPDYEAIIRARMKAWAPLENFGDE